MHTGSLLNSTHANCALCTVHPDCQSGFMQGRNTEPTLIMSTTFTSPLCSPQSVGLANIKKTNLSTCLRLVYLTLTYPGVSYNCPLKPAACSMPLKMYINIWQSLAIYLQVCPFLAPDSWYLSIRALLTKDLVPNKL